VLGEYRHYLPGIIARPTEPSALEGRVIHRMAFLQASQSLRLLMMCIQPELSV
jgi:hypothetical protein